jgi:hypothetical protein
MFSFVCVFYISTLCFGLKNTEHRFNFKTLYKLIYKEIVKMDVQPICISIHNMTLKYYIYKHDLKLQDLTLLFYYYA